MADRILTIEDKPRHLRRYEVSGAFFPMSMVTGIVYQIMEGVPVDCRLVGFRWDEYTSMFHCTLEHPSFEVVNQGDQIPLHTIKFARIIRAKVTDKPEAPSADAPQAN